MDELIISVFYSNTEEALYQTLEEIPYSVFWQSYPASCFYSSFII